MNLNFTGLIKYIKIKIKIAKTFLIINNDEAMWVCSL